LRREFAEKALVEPALFGVHSSRSRPKSRNYASAPRGDGEGGVDEPVDRAARLDDELSNVDQLAGKLSGYMYAQQHFVGHSKHELDDRPETPRFRALAFVTKEHRPTS